MEYTEELVYELVGRDDKSANVSFRTKSESFIKYGTHVTVLFLYSQYEREDLDQRLNNPASKTHGFIKVRHLISQLDEKTVRDLENEGIHTEDISSILFYPQNRHNIFHSTEKRSITKIDIPIRLGSKGRDYNWIYGFVQKTVKEGIGISPKERQFYLAGKLYFEAKALTEEEENEIYSEGDVMEAGIEMEYLSIKYRREEITDYEIKRLRQLIKIKEKEEFELLDRYLIETGTNFSKMVKGHLDTTTQLFIRIKQYKERRFNVTGKQAIFLPIDRYLHVYTRHVEELKFNKQFQNKSNFQWNEEDVIIVIEKVIDKINSEIQEFFKMNPGRRYSRYGRQSVYFEGDYYTLHIEANGSISTFYRNRKTHEQSQQNS